ncbi:MAG TPA: glucose 1-dehydrogenase [Anaeromyxobacteraceae bacterium]|nr:glucose 1-dehydrogenase [Anaeromyxobacteraceae bacterium]
MAAFPAERRVRAVDHPAPEILSPSQVALRVLEVGLCGTDREIAAFRHGAPPDDSPYLIIGHEAMGEVVEAGSAVHRLRPGDLVVPLVRRPCLRGDCRACRMGRPDFCQSGEFVQCGIRGAHGFLAETVVDDARWLVPVPPELRDVGVLAQPLALAEKALHDLEAARRRLPWAATEPAGGEAGRAVVLGAGPVAMLGAMALLVRGFRTTVYAQEPRGPRTEFVESLGASYASAREEPFEAVAGRLGGIDVVYEASGASQMALEALEHLGPNGAWFFSGVPGRRGPIPLEAGRFLANLALRNQVVFGSVNAGAEAYRAAVQDLALFARRWPTLLPRLVRRHAFEETPDLLQGQAGGVKRVVSLGS